MNYSDEQLVNNYLKGDEKSLEVIIKNYLKPIYNFIYHFINGRPETEDITQEVFVKVWRHLKKFNPEKSFKTWLYIIARNTAIDFLKKKKHLNFSDLETKEENITVDNILVDPEPLPSELFDQKDLAERLSAVMQKLSPRNRVILYFFYYEHFTLQEISEILNEPINTVKSLHRRAIIKLRELLKDAPKCIFQSY